MRKADEQAISRYPAIKGERSDDILMKRIAFVEGYEQALKDYKINTNMDAQHTLIETLFSRLIADGVDEGTTGLYEFFHALEMWLCIIALDIKPYRDGNQWCFLYGEDIQSGICGFGDTIEEAAQGFYMNLLREKE